MFFWHLLFLVCLTLGEELTDEEYKLLPKRFVVNDNFKCQDSSKYFSKIVVKLDSNLEVPSKIWKVIEKAESDVRRFSYKTVKFGYCLDQNEDFAEFAKNAENNITKMYDNMGLVSRIEHIKYYDLIQEKDFIDYLLLLVIIGLFLFALYATMQHTKNKNNEHFPNNHPILNAFSLFTSFKAATREARQSEYGNFNHFEGLRTILAYITVTYHVLCALFSTFHTNPDFLEEMNFSPVLQVAIKFTGFFMIPFMTLSGFVLGMQIYIIIEMKGKLSLRHVVLLVVNRFLRFLPLVIFTVLVHASRFSMVEMSSSLNKYVVMDEFDRCRVNGWKTILFLHSINHNPHPCAIHTWYLATDLYIYTLGITLVYLCLKLHLNTIKYLIITGLVSVIYQGWSLYKMNNVQGFMTVEPKVDSIDWLHTKHFWLVHVSITQHASTFIIGLIAGKAYVQYRKNKEFIKKWRGNAYIFQTLGLMLLALISTYIKYDLIGNYVCSLIGKNIFVVAMAIWFLGMSTNPTSKSKKFLDNKFLVFFSKFAFSLYLIHFHLVILNFTKIDEILTINSAIVLKSIALMIVLSTLASVMMYFLLENPLAELQRLLKKKLDPKPKLT